MAHKVYIKLEPHKVKNQAYVNVLFDSNQKIENELRVNFNAIWKKALKCWSIPGETFNPFIFFNHFNEIAEIDYSSLKGVSLTFSKNTMAQHPPNKLPAGFLDALIIKRYSENTIKTYCSYFLEFQSYFSKTDIRSLSPDQIKEYILHLIRERDISISQQNQRISAIKFYYEKILAREKLKFYIERPKKERKLPGVLDKAEVLEILNSTTNIKHKCILSLIYSAGLRRNELLNLQSGDIDSKRMLLKIRGGKGKKDRYTTLSENCCNCFVNIISNTDQRIIFSRVLMAVVTQPPVCKIFLKISKNSRSKEEGPHPYVETFICYPFTGARDKFENYPGTAGARKYKNYRDLHSYHQIRYRKN
jgi:integrase/recombinase XerD